MGELILYIEKVTVASPVVRTTGALTGLLVTD